MASSDAPPSLLSWTINDEQPPSEDTDNVRVEIDVHNLFFMSRTKKDTPSPPRMTTLTAAGHVDNPNPMMRLRTHELLPPEVDWANEYLTLTYSWGVLRFHNKGFDAATFLTCRNAYSVSPHLSPWVRRQSPGPGQIFFVEILTKMKPHRVPIKSAGKI